MSAVYYTISCLFVMLIGGTKSLNKQYQWNSPEPDKQYLDYTIYSTHQIRAKMIRLMRELICDADAKVMSIQYIKREFAQSGKFHLGELIYNIRNKHGFMVRKLMLSQANLNVSWEASWYNDKFIEHTIRMQNMFQDIDHMVQMAVELDATDPSGRLFARMGPIVDEDENIDEENLRRTKNLKQRAYMERKKKEWALVNGYDISNKSTRLMLRNKNKEEGGFDSDTM